MTLMRPVDVFASIPLPPRLSPRARRRLARQSVFGAGALAATIAAAEAGASAAPAFEISGEAADSLDDILAFAEVCAQQGAAAGSRLHAFHGADGHEGHAFFEAAFAARYASSLCGGARDAAHDGHMADAAHAGHANDHAVGAHGAHIAHNAAHGEGHAGTHAADAHDGESHAGGDAPSGRHAHIEGAASAPAHDHDTSVGEALAHLVHDGAHDALHLAGLFGETGDNGDLSAGLDALMGGSSTAASAPNAPGYAVAPPPAASEIALAALEAPPHDHLPPPPVDI